MPALEIDAARPDLRMPALGAAAWAGALVVRQAGWVVLAAGVAVGVAAALPLLRRRRRRPWVATLLAALLVASAVGAATVVRTAAVTENPVADLAERRALASVEGTVVSDPRPIMGRFESRFALRLSVRRVRASGVDHELRAPVLVLGDDTWETTEVGSRVRAIGRLAPADDDDLAALLPSPATPEVVRRPDAWWRGANAVRQAIRASVAHRDPAQAAIVPALVDGGDAHVPTDVREQFRVTGLTHLMAVSGTNLTLVVGFLVLLARWVGARGRWLWLVGALGIVGFMLLARSEPSVVRAGAMGAVGLVAMSANGRHRAVRCLGVAVVGLLLLDPGLAVTVGFALSVLATAGLVLLAPAIRDALARWLPRSLAEAIAVPAAAQLAVTPVIAAISGQVSLVAVVANLVASPMVGPATVLGLAGGLVTLLLPMAGTWVGSCAAWCVAWILWVARRGAALPGAAVEWETDATALVVLTLLCVVAGLAAPHLLRRGATGVACCLLMLVVVSVRLPTPGWPPSGWVLVMCDVGQGDALALRAGEREVVVVDAGPDAAAVARCLGRLGVKRVPTVVLTHFHADHVDGLPGVLRGRQVGAVETTRVLDPATGVHAVAEATAVADVPVVLAPYGEPRRVGAVELQVVWPEPGPFEPAHDGRRANDASVVVLAEVGGVRLLLTGDVEPPGQAVLSRQLAGLQVDVLKVPHHGSRYQNLAWLTSLGAEVALVSAGADNDYGHPNPEVLDALVGSGTRVHRTDLEGDVAVVVKAGRLEVRTRS